MSGDARMRRERRTIEAMIGIYCHGQHGSHDALCADCQSLLDYALVRLDKCPFHESKTTCANCPVHCYARDMRERIRAVMRYAGPRMLLRHPVLTLYHFLDGRRKQPLGFSSKASRTG
jgi:predicted amidophosphoribosyltransferase